MYIFILLLNSIMRIYHFRKSPRTKLPVLHSSASGTSECKQSQEFHCSRQKNVCSFLNIQYFFVKRKIKAYNIYI